MTDVHDIEKKFWKALKSDRTLMLGLEGSKGAAPRPLTALLDDGEKGPLWIFTATDTEIVRDLIPGASAVGTFISKGHDVFATLHGSLSLSNDRAVIDRLWNPFVAAWYEGGKDDPQLALLRYDAEQAEIWVDGSSLMAGLKILMGIDPKSDYKDKVAKVNL